MTLKPQNDHAMVQLDREGPFGSQTPGAESGILVAIPKELPYLGFHSFAWENSFGAWNTLAEYRKKYESLVGRRVYWSSMKERGSVIEQDGDRYAFIKLTDIIADSEADEAATNVYGTEGGTFTV